MTPLITIYHNTNSHAGTSDREVIRKTRALMKAGVRQDRAKRAARHAAYRGVLQHHHQWQRIVASIR